MNDVRTDLYFFDTGHHKELSNLYPTTIQVNGTIYPTVEHLYQSYRFLPKKPSHQQANYVLRLHQSESAEEVRRLGEHPEEGVKERVDWDEIKEDVMLQCLRAKFNQCEECKQVLLSTGNKVLHYSSDTTSDYWGTGKNSMGKDRLGALMMIVRREIEINENF